MLSKLKKLCGVFTTLSATLVVVLAVALVGIRLVGLTPFVVLSGSMEPQYPVGALIYVTGTDPYALQPQDPVTYRMPDGTVVTHRIITVLPDPEREGSILYRTKGDANNIPDGALLAPDRVIGRPVFSIPLLGYVAHFIQNPPGSYVAISFCLLLLVLPAFVDTLISLKEKKEDPDEPDETVS